MRVRVTVTVDIDPVVWDMNYGTGSNLSAIRADVQDYCKHTLYGQLEHVGVLTKKEVGL